MNCTSNNPAKIERNLNIAQDRLSGLNYHQIAANNKCSIATVSYVLNDKEIKEIVETGIRKQVSLIPLADSVLYDCLTDKDDKQYRFKAAETIYKNTGIAPSHAQSQTIINIFNQNNTIIQDPKLLSMMEKYSQESVTDVDLGLDEDIIDID